ncbi:hypothetical protein Psta_2254 [Pirellula staleyi DSM 6068]|uniref:Uncharacterized protein n=1 Tax=Pirellula staleyi (strain ATCC 27377 / DSM 6068 / ICPB 4128) TaxID=530564 RepID=D2R2T5_PIRSD|nr:hypothetical protein [Pirellula staleyi]ADB16925.1 hypothetical protein Psta_2254 [Pirellula staleyi DSM 6068]
MIEGVVPIPWDGLIPLNLNPLLSICQSFYAYSAVNSSDNFYRSSELAALAKQVLPESCHTRFSRDIAKAFSQYTSEKSRLSSKSKPIQNVRFNSNDPLSLLLVNWRESLFDGAGSPETYGFIDDDWIPGWDTWLAIVSLNGKPNEHALLCWVPSELCREVDSAINLDAARCMSWLAYDHTNKPYLVGWGQRWKPSILP